MIISVTGRIGHGKDTVGSIIQYLTSDCSKKKSKHYRTYQEFLKLSWYYSDWEIKKWAGKLKVVASLLTGIPIEKFENQEFKEKTLLGPEWGTVKPNPLNAIPPFADIAFNNLMSVRELLQKLGTEAVRNGLHPNAWVNALMCDYTKDALWIITDTRFPNEYEEMIKRDALTIKVVKPCSLCSGVNYHKISCPKMKSAVLHEHESENSLDGFHFDYEITNDGSIEDLIKKVKKVLKREKLI
jgi:hypothetical protein